MQNASFLLTLLGLAVQIGGFIYLARLGARVSDRMQQQSSWRTLGLAAAVLVVAFVICVAAGTPLTFIPQTVALFCAGFAGGIVVRERSRLIGR